MFFLSNWGTVATNRHISLYFGTTALTWATLTGAVVIGGNYGLHHVLSGVQYESLHFSFIDTAPKVVGTTYYYCLVGRGNTADVTGINLGNSAYSEITVEELI